MAIIAALLATLRSRWVDGPGLHLPTPLDVDNVRKRFPGISETYLAMLSAAGIPADVDVEGVRFWRPQELELASNVLSSADYRCSSTAKDWLVFADYFEESWWYAVGLAPPFLEKVALFGGDTHVADDTRHEIGSFDEFLHAYEKMGPRMFPSGEAW